MFGQSKEERSKRKRARINEEKGRAEHARLKKIADDKIKREEIMGNGGIEKKTVMQRAEILSDTGILAEILYEIKINNKRLEEIITSNKEIVENTKDMVNHGSNQKS